MRHCKNTALSRRIIFLPLSFSVSYLFQLHSLSGLGSKRKFSSDKSHRSNSFTPCNLSSLHNACLYDQLTCITLIDSSFILNFHCSKCSVYVRSSLEFSPWLPTVHSSFCQYASLQGGWCKKSGRFLLKSFSAIVHNAPAVN